MRADEGRRLCREAEVHYYDLLGPDEAAVPESVCRHVAACPACQEQMRRLREALFEAQRHPGPARSGDDETIEALAQQFQLLDEHVTCADVKPFLPKLALASPQIRIPTPVTVHVDHCSRCAADLAAIQELDLTTDQLKRLSGFFEQSWGRDAGEGRQTQTAARAARESAPVEDAEIACRDISKTDLFDDVVPYGTPRDERHKAVASHIRACRRCREKERALHRAIWAILERTDSETTTVYHAQRDGADSPEEAGNLYPYPIDVQVLHGASGCGAGPGTRRRHSTFSSGPEDSPVGPPPEEKAECPLFPARHLARAAVVAVAVAALLMFRWVNAPTASGTDVGDLLKTLAKVRSIHVLTMDRNDKPIREFWVAYRSNRLVTRTAERCVLYDLDRGRTRTIEPAAGVSPPVKLSKTEYDGARRLMANCLRDVMARVSPDAKLHPPTGDLGGQTVENLDVYETTWLSRTGSLPLHSGWRVYIDPARGLPQKTEFYRERPGATRGATHWGLVTTTVFTYPTEQEMDRDIETLFPAR